jgi:hypothetical protein
MKFFLLFLILISLPLSLIYAENYAVVPLGFTFNRDLSRGSSGQDVQYLQCILGVTPVTGFFGPKTKKAVINFQNTHAADILTPVGLTTGSGFVGSSTRSYLNSQIQQNGLSGSQVPCQVTDQGNGGGNGGNGSGSGSSASQSQQNQQNQQSSLSGLLPLLLLFGLGGNGGLGYHPSYGNGSYLNPNGYTSNGEPIYPNQPMGGQTNNTGQSTSYNSPQCPPGTHVMAASAVSDQYNCVSDTPTSNSSNSGSNSSAQGFDFSGTTDYYSKNDPKISQYTDSIGYTAVPCGCKITANGLPNENFPEYLYINANENKNNNLYNKPVYLIINKSTLPDILNRDPNYQPQTTCVVGHYRPLTPSDVCYTFNQNTHHCEVDQQFQPFITGVVTEVDSTLSGACLH